MSLTPEESRELEKAREDARKNWEKAQADIKRHDDDFKRNHPDKK